MQACIFSRDEKVARRPDVLCKSRHLGRTGARAYIIMSDGKVQYVCEECLEDTLLPQTYMKKTYDWGPLPGWLPSWEVERYIRQQNCKHENMGSCVHDCCDKCQDCGKMWELPE